jgi:nucleoid-associated protein YgaU
MVRAQLVALLMVAALAPAAAAAAAPRRLLGATGASAAAAAAAMRADAAAPATVAEAIAAAAAGGGAAAAESAFLCNWDGELCTSSPEFVFGAWTPTNEVGDSSLQLVAVDAACRHQGARDACEGTRVQLTAGSAPVAACKWTPSFEMVRRPGGGC